MSALVVIPSRWGSSRFPGKPLADLRGKTLLQRVILAASQVKQQRRETQIVVATDDERIARHAEINGCRSVMTARELESGTARTLAAVRQCKPQPDHVLNMQGDTPFIAPSTLCETLDALDGSAEVATPVVQLDWPGLEALREQKVGSPFSGTTCVRGEDGRALWFSKQIIPAIRDEARRKVEQPLSPVFRHIGVYAYTRLALEKFVAGSAGRYEQIENLEQLRFLELGIGVRTVIVSPPRISMSGIDTPADLKRACDLIDKFGEPSWE